MEKKAKFTFTLFLIAITLIAACSKVQRGDSSGVVSTSNMNVEGKQLQGFLTDLKINGESFSVGSPIIVSGVFHAQTDGNYYSSDSFKERGFDCLGMAKNYFS